MNVEDLERRISALEERVREQDKIIAYLYAYSLPSPYSLKVSQTYRSVLTEKLESMRQIISGEKQVCSWGVKYGELLSPELEDPPEKATKKE